MSMILDKSDVSIELSAVFVLACEYDVFDNNVSPEYNSYYIQKIFENKITHFFELYNVLLRKKTDIFRKYSMLC